MEIVGIDLVRFVALDLATCQRFFLDFGLRLLSSDIDHLVFETLNGSQVEIASQSFASKHHWPEGLEADPTLREVIWAVPDEAALASFEKRLKELPSVFRGVTEQGSKRELLGVDPSGLQFRLRVSHKRIVDLQSALSNTWSKRERIDAPSPAYMKAEPVEVGHVVLFVTNLDAMTTFYCDVLGFTRSDRYPGRGEFLRSSKRGGHHDLFMLQLPNRAAGLNHVAFTVRDVHEVIGGGMHMQRSGHATELGPGRHPISSAMFWYLESPVGGLLEYYTDEDELTENWQAREFSPGPTVFAEWAIAGGIDGNTRRQASGHQALVASPGAPAFLTDKKK